MFAPASIFLAVIEIKIRGCLTDQTRMLCVKQLCKPQIYPNGLNQVQYINKSWHWAALFGRTGPDVGLQRSNLFSHHSLNDPEQSQLRYCFFSSYLKVASERTRLSLGVLPMSLCGPFFYLQEYQEPWLAPAPLAGRGGPAWRDQSERGAGPVLAQ